MARKNIVEGYPIINGTSLATSFTSSTSSVKNLDYASIHIEWSGTAPVGVITVEARNGDERNNDAVADWYLIDMGSVITISGASGDHQLFFDKLPFTDLRLQYTATSGTGTMTAFITSKQSGG